MIAFHIYLAATLALWVYVSYLWATGARPPAWLLWPLLVDLAIDLISVALNFRRGRSDFAAWRVLMACVDIATLLWVVRAK